LGSPHPIVAVEELAEPRLLMSAGVSREEGVGLQDGTEALHRADASVPDFGQVCEVGLDLTIVPGEQDRFNVREVLVQRGAADPGLLGDPRHRHTPQAVLLDERGRPIQRRIADRSAVGLDRVGPEFRHPTSIRCAEVETQWVDNDTMYR
jgi:hypothetical protein